MGRWAQRRRSGAGRSPWSGVPNPAEFVTVKLGPTLGHLRVTYNAPVLATQVGMGVFSNTTNGGTSIACTQVTSYTLDFLLDDTNNNVTDDVHYSGANLGVVDGQDGSIE